MATDQERTTLAGSELFRWLILAALIVAGIALFFYFGSVTEPVVPPSVQETTR
jgi:hypothetical protein